MNNADYLVLPGTHSPASPQLVSAFLPPAAQTVVPTVEPLDSATTVKGTMAEAAKRYGISQHRVVVKRYALK